MTVRASRSVDRCRCLVALVICAQIAGCGGEGLSGEYHDPRGVTGYEFQPDGRVFVSVMGTTTVTTYEVEGDRVVIDGPDGVVVLRRHGDELHGPMGLELTRDL